MSLTLGETDDGRESPRFLEVALCFFHGHPEGLKFECPW